MPALSLSQDAFENISEHHRVISSVELPTSGVKVSFVCISEERLYTSSYKTLYVYSMSDLSLPIASYYFPTGGCLSGLIANNFLFLGSFQKIIVYEINEISTAMDDLDLTLPP
jgi:hypothetical protein